MLTHTSLQGHSNIKGSAGGNSATNTRHRHDCNVLHLDISGGFGDEDQTLVQEVKQTFVGFDRALNSVVAVVASKVLGWHDHLLTRQSTEDLGHNLVNWLLVV